MKYYFAIASTVFLWCQCLASEASQKKSFFENVPSDPNSETYLNTGLDGMEKATPSPQKREPAQAVPNSENGDLGV